MATRTAPAVTATATRRLLTIRMIDASGDLTAETLEVPVAATAASLETIVATYQLATQTSVYSVTDVMVREGDADPDNADALQRSSIAQGINTLFKSGTVTEQVRIIAPVASIMQGNQDIPLMTASVFSDLVLAILAVKTGYTFRRSQYTERRERKNNPVLR